MRCYRSRLVFVVAFKTLDISQGSVATHLRYGEISNDRINTHFLLILTVKNFVNRLTLIKLKLQKIVPIFLGYPVYTADGRWFEIAQSWAPGTQPCQNLERTATSISETE